MGGENRLRVASSYPRFAEKPVGKQIHHIYVDRLRQFTSTGQYESQNLISKLHEGYASGAPAVKLSTWPAPDLSRPTFEEATSHLEEYQPAKIGDFFGPSWATHWFQVKITVPDELRNKRHLELHWDANNEGMVWTEDGVPLQGLTGGGERIEWILPENFRDGKEHTIYIEMACNGMFGNAPGGDPNEPPSNDKYFRLDKADIVAVNLDARHLFIDFWIIGDAAREFPENSWEEHAALQVCNKIMDHFIAKQGSKEAIVDCRKIAQKYVGDKVNSSKVYDEPSNAMISAIGHCHIDTCWLWPFAETKRKIARSWLNQCDLMERYPEHRFCASSAQQYKWLKMYYPAAFDRVKEKVKQGQFHPIGGSWVEHDTNIPAGESLVRAFVYGQRFFESHFGERSTTFWLPDTFGYSTQLPQLCRMAGMSRFFTQKLSWNNINNFPHTTFNWVALDGSQVLCHMTPCETYTADAHFGDVRRSVTQHKSMDQDPSSLLVFGKGDGGGGPTWEHLEKLRRCRGVADTNGGLPRLKMGDSVDDFFVKLEKTAEKGTEFATWYGELYFELHRGTYTTQANNKKNNRHAEKMMHDIEFVATFASIQDLVVPSRTQYNYPKKAIDGMWEDILLCQFHDCLPGSCIEMCYRDTDEIYANLFKRGSEVFEEAVAALGLEPSFAHDKPKHLVAINTLSQARSKVVRSQKLHFSEKLDHECFTHAVLQDSQSLTRLQPSSSSPACQIVHASRDTYILHNSDLQIQVSNGTITSLFDKISRRELIPPGAHANQPVLFDDKPLYWQAWDVEVYHLRSRQPLAPHKVSIFPTGPDAASLLIETAISPRSWMKTTMTLTANSSSPPSSSSSSSSDSSTRLRSLLHFSTDVSWHEDKKFLKVEFPLDLRADTATYETQFGLVRRPTHANTSWDAAKFEVCCHRFADLSEATYGASVLNDCKYGFACEGGVMRLSLLRASKAPDGHADMGRHTFRYGLLPHAGPLAEGTVRAAREFNAQIGLGAPGSESVRAEHGKGWDDGERYLRMCAPERLAAAADAMNCVKLAPGSDPGVVLDTVKRGEDDTACIARGGPEDDVLIRPESAASRSVVLRVYDALGGRCRGRVEWRKVVVGKVVKANLLEDAEEEVEIEEGGEGFAFELRAFEVATFKLVLAERKEE